MMIFDAFNVTEAFSSLEDYHCSSVAQASNAMQSKASPDFT